MCSLWICGVYPFEVVLDFVIAPPNAQHMHAVLLLQDICEYHMRQTSMCALQLIFQQHLPCTTDTTPHPYNCFISIISQEEMKICCAYHGKDY